MALKILLLTLRIVLCCLKTLTLYALFSMYTCTVCVQFICSPAPLHYLIHSMKSLCVCHTDCILHAIYRLHGEGNTHSIECTQTFYRMLIPYIVRNRSTARFFEENLLLFSRDNSSGLVRARNSTAFLYCVYYIEAAKSHNDRPSCHHQTHHHQC